MSGQCSCYLKDGTRRCRNFAKKTTKFCSVHQKCKQVFSLGTDEKKVSKSESKAKSKAMCSCYSIDGKRQCIKADPEILKKMYDLYLVETESGWRLMDGDGTMWRFKLKPAHVFSVYYFTIVIDVEGNLYECTTDNGGDNDGDDGDDDDEDKEIDLAKIVQIPGKVTNHCYGGGWNGTAYVTVSHKNKLTSIFYRGNGYPEKETFDGGFDWAYTGDRNEVAYAADGDKVYIETRPFTIKGFSQLSHHDRMIVCDQICDRIDIDWRIEDFEASKSDIARLRPYFEQVI